MGNNPSHPHPSHPRHHPAASSSQSTPTSTPTSAAATLNPFSSASPHSLPTPPQSQLGPPLPPLRTTFVDGGYLLPLSNIYPASQQDWLHYLTQRLILSRKLAPFYRGLEDWEPSWDQARIQQALADSTAARRKLVQDIERKEAKEKAEQDKLTVSGLTSRRLGKTLEGQINASQISPDLNPLLRKEIFDAILLWDPRSEEAVCYLNEATECPICFLYYPPNINLSRCCQQPICTECFVQIKRAEPTAQELKSEPACCPYCVESNFGVTYEPPKRPGLTIPSHSESAPSPVLTPDTNSHSLSASSSPIPSDSPHPKRRQNTSHTSVDVVTTDSVQPDWQAKLEAVKATVQRRANRRIIFRQEGDRLVPVGITSSRDPTGSAFLAGLEQDTTPSSSIARRGLSALVGGSSSSGSGTRRSRLEPSYNVDLEELMIMEAMRLSLAEEEERKKKAAEDEAKLQGITRAISEACGQATMEPTTSTAPRSSSSAPVGSGSTPLGSGLIAAGLSTSPMAPRSSSSTLLGSSSLGAGSSPPAADAALLSTDSSQMPIPIPVQPSSNSMPASTKASAKSTPATHSTPLINYAAESLIPDSQSIPNITSTVTSSAVTTRSAPPTTPFNTTSTLPATNSPEAVPNRRQIPFSMERSVSSRSSIATAPVSESAFEDLAEYEPLVGHQMELD